MLFQTNVTNCGLELRWISILRHGDDNLNIVSSGPEGELVTFEPKSNYVHYLLVWSQPSLELGLRLDHDLNPAVGVPLNHWLDPDQRLGRKYFARKFFNLVLPWRGCWVYRTLIQTPHRGEWRILSCHSQTWIVQVQSQYFKSYWSNTGPG